MRVGNVGRGRTLGVAAAALVVAGALACGGSSEDKPAATPAVPEESTTMVAVPATEGARVLFVGTSLTAGLGLDPESAYPAVIQRLADSAGFRVQVVAAGLSGETSAGALRRVDWLLQERADVVVIETGANDGLRGLDPDTTEANIAGIVAKIRAANPDSRVVLAQMEAPPNLGPRYTREFRDVFMNISRDHAVTLIPFFLQGVAGESEFNQADGIHPNEEGARRAARNMWRALAPVLAETPGVVVR